MKKLTAANSPLLALIKSQFNKPIFKAASMLANASGEAAVVDYMGQFYNEDARPAALKRFAALVAEAGPIVKNSQDGNAVTLNQNARVACSNTLGVPLETPSAEDNRPIQGPLSFSDADVVIGVAQSEAYGWPIEAYKWPEFPVLQGAGLIELIDGERYPRCILTLAGLEYLADELTRLPGLTKSQWLDLRHVAQCESAGEPSAVREFSTYEFLERQGLIEPMPSLLPLFDHCYIMTPLGLKVFADELTR